MISHSLGAMPRRTEARLAEFSRQWTTRSIRAWEEGWWRMPISVGNLVGRIIGAGEGEVTMHQNVSLCQSLVLSCFDWRGPRDGLVTEDADFPSNQYVHHASGARVVVAPPGGLIEAIDERTQLVSVSHVTFRTSEIRDLGAIVRRAHEVGALVIADLYQSAGAVPVDVRALGVDFATGGSVKWLCGGPGAAYLYVRRDLWPSLRPRATGWQAHARPFEFEAGAVDYADDAARFLTGTPNIPGLYAAMSGYEIIAEVGVERIRAKSLRLTAHLAALAETAGFPVVGPRRAQDRGGTVVIDVPNGREVTRELLRRDILVDYRPGAGIRAAPHFYSTNEEVERLVAEIADVAARLQ